MSGITEQRFPTGRIYRGHADRFIAAGLLTEHEIPGRPGCPGREAFPFKRDGRWFRVTRGRKQVEQIMLRIRGSYQELEEVGMQGEAEERFARIESEFRKEMRYMPKSRDAYARRLRACLEPTVLRELLLKPEFGYSVQEKALNVYFSAVGIAMDTLCENICFDKRARERQIAGWKQKLAQADPQLSRFIATATVNAAIASNHVD
jgi:hypothetical protein